MNWSMILRPILGALIGYFTNYIAVKMLFRPKKEIFLFGRKLPFTPGAIPKGKPRLARAVGRAVSDTLITKEDIADRLLSEETKQKVVGKTLAVLDKNLNDAILSVSGAEIDFGQVTDTVAAKLTDEIALSFHNLPLEQMVFEKGGALIREKTAGTMLQMFISDGLIASFSQPVANALVEYVDGEGKGYIQKELTDRLAELFDQPAAQLLEGVEINREQLERILSDFYKRAGESLMDQFWGSVQIDQMVENKINSMSVDELETLVLSVMKTELNMIVNLGALIGFVLGLLNLLF